MQIVNTTVCQSVQFLDFEDMVRGPALPSSPFQAIWGFNLWNCALCTICLFSISHARHRFKANAASKASLCPIFVWFQNMTNISFTNYWIAMCLSKCTNTSIQIYTCKYKKFKHITCRYAQVCTGMHRYAHKKYWNFLNIWKAGLGPSVS